MISFTLILSHTSEYSLMGLATNSYIPYITL